jgi:hypothetical protein
MAESWAFVFLPLIVLMNLKFLKNPKIRSLCLASISLSLLFITHNVTTLTFGPLFALLFLVAGIMNKISVKKIAKYFAVLLFWSVALASFFFLPAYLEKSLAHTESLTSGYFNFLAHFVSLKQSLLTYFWAYGSSEIGPTDDLSFMVGPFQLILLLLILIKLAVTKFRENSSFVSIFIVLCNFLL